MLTASQLWHSWTFLVCLTACLGLLLTSQLTHAVNVNPQNENYVPDFSIYHNLSSVIVHLNKLAVAHSNIIKIDWTYHSRNGLPQLVTRISNFSSQLNPSEDQETGPFGNEMPKIHVLLSFGEHAREFFPVESFFYLLKNLTSGITAPPGSQEERYSRSILTNFDIYAIVVANPDGRKYVEASSNFCWRGTSTGVDINRNFDWQFAQKGSSADPKDEEFRGPYAFSEPECSVYLDLTEKIPFDAFVSLHSGIRHIYMPFADTASKLLKRDPPNYHHLAAMASRLSKVTKYKFRFGKAYDLNFYTADGTAFDYMAAVQKVPFSLAIELWENRLHRGASCFDQFNPRSEHVAMEAEAVHPLYVELFSYLLHWKFQQQSPVLPSPVTQPPSMTLNSMLLIIVFAIFMGLVYKNRHHICATKRRIVHLRRLSSTFTMGGIFR